MAGFSSYNDDDFIAEINVTPLVDVSLVLLIIFIVTSAIIVRAAIQVNLPTAATAGDVLPDSISIILKLDGSIQVEGQVVEPEQLQAVLVQRASENPEVRALIAADTELEYGRVMEVIDMVRQAEMAGFSLNVERGNAPQTPIN